MLEGKGLRAIANVIKLSGGEVPEWMTQLKPTRKQLGGREGGRMGGRKDGGVQRRGRISTGTAWDRERAKRKSKAWGGIKQKEAGKIYKKAGDKGGEGEAEEGEK